MQADAQSLADLALGERCRILHLDSNSKNRRRMLDLGLIPGTEVEAVLKSPSGGVTAYLIRGAVIAIRNEDAVNIIIDNTQISE